MLKRCAIIAAIVLGQVLAPTGALAINDRADEAILLTAANATVGDTLVGDSGGAYRYYAIDYAGGGQPVPITMRARPGRGTAGVATGFKVYGPNGLVGDAIGDDRSTDESGYYLTLANTTPGRYLVQVYNYIAGMPMTFQLTATGLGPGAVAPAPQAAPAAGAAPAQPVVPAADPTSPERAVVVTQRSVTTGGVLPGQRDGNFHYFWLDYPGGRTDMGITLGYSPTTPNSEQAVGFKLYRADPGGATLVAESGQTGRNESSATEGFTLNTEAAERYLLQIHNYLDGVAINYTLIVTGLAGPVAEVGDISSPATAFVLSAAQPAARGALVGDRSGRFHYFLVNYPGGDREVRLTVTAEPNGNIGEGMLGLNLYKGADQVGTAAAGLDGKGRRVATLTIKESEARTFGIQVYNYSPGAEARYAITVTGL